MEAIGYVVIAVMAVGVIGGLVMLSSPSPWNEIGEQRLELEQDAAPDSVAGRRHDEAELRALIAAKRAARGLAPRAAPRVPPHGGHRLPWHHLDPEVVEEAEQLMLRRQARLARQGKSHDHQAELERLLGPPHPD